MRWRIARPKRFRGFAQLRADVCAFTRYSGNGHLQALVIRHVEDILFEGASETSLTLKKRYEHFEPEAPRSCRRKPP